MSFTAPWQEELHPRWPAGTPGGLGGKFKMVNTASGPVEVGINLTENELVSFARDTEHRSLRIMRDKAGNIYAWDASLAVHENVLGKLGLKPEDVGPADADIWEFVRGRLQSTNGASAARLGGKSDREVARDAQQQPLRWLAGQKAGAVARRDEAEPEELRAGYGVVQERRCLPEFPPR